jgi:hypothetical protein
MPPVTNLTDRFQVHMGDDWIVISSGIPHGPLRDNLLFVGILCLHLQCQRASKATNKKEASRVEKNLDRNRVFSFITWEVRERGTITFVQALQRKSHPLIMYCVCRRSDRPCGLVVRVLGYRSGGPVSIPGTTRKKSSGSGTGSTQPREYNWGATWKKSSGSGL